MTEKGFYMKVKELIKRLVDLDNNADIVCDGYEDGVSKIVMCRPIVIIPFYHEKNDNEQEGVYAKHAVFDGFKKGATEEAVYIGTGRLLSSGA